MKQGWLFRKEDGGWYYEGFPKRKTTFTSANNPIRVDWIPSWAFESKGRLGMTIGPGKKHENGMTGAHRRDMSKDLDRLVSEYDTDVLVTLMEQKEMNEYDMQDLFPGLVERGISSLWFPIRDTSIPTSMMQTRWVVSRILDNLHAGLNVVVHCRGGHGRTGTLVACTLVEVGHSPADAMKITRVSRAGTIHNVAQEDFVRLYRGDVQE